MVELCTDKAHVNTKLSLGISKLAVPSHDSGREPRVSNSTLLKACNIASISSEYVSRVPEGMLSDPVLSTVEEVEPPVAVEVERRGDDIQFVKRFQ